jgi:hypothetical protein
MELMYFYRQLSGWRLAWHNFSQVKFNSICIFLGSWIYFRLIGGIYANL